MNTNVSERQLAANRKNARKSTGPRTRVGKNRNRLNALKHGTYAKTLILNIPGFDENANDFKAIRADVHGALKPRDAHERRELDRIVILLWRLERLRRMRKKCIEENREQVDIGKLNLIEMRLMRRHCRRIDELEQYRLDSDSQTNQTNPSRNRCHRSDTEKGQTCVN